jgi:hypothetical protein
MDHHSDHRVKGGDFEVICPNDGQIISSSNFARMVVPGMVVE